LHLRGLQAPEIGYEVCDVVRGIRRIAGMPMLQEYVVQRRCPVVVKELIPMRNAAQTGGIEFLHSVNVGESYVIGRW
jgi:hypothetical protein